MRIRIVGAFVPLMTAAVVLLVPAVHVAGQNNSDVALPAGCPADPKLYRPCALEKAKQFNPPRTLDGNPNFQGVWLRNQGISSFILEEHPQSRGVPGGKSLIVDPPDGMIPYQPWARAKRAEIMNTYIDQVSNCLPPGVPRHFLAPGPYQIVQTPGYVTFLLEHAGHTRIIPTDGRSHIGPTTRLWQGDSVGHWEGNTLVIDTTNLNGQAFLSIVTRDFTSASLHVVERYTLVDADNILFEATVEDPTVFERPWTMAWGRIRDQRKGMELLEEACYEGNRSNVHAVPNRMFLGLSDQEKP